MGNFTKFTNLKTHTEPETTLFQQEIDVILTVINQVLASFEMYPTRGTFILDGQKKGEDAKCIIRFNLEDGTYSAPHGADYTSNDVAAIAINDVLSWPEVPAYDYKGEARYFGQLPSGIYKRGLRRVLVLNTTYGRFLISFFANCRCGGIDEHDGSSALLLALTVAFASIDHKDKVLQQSAKVITEFIALGEKFAMDVVRELFAKCELPALKVWKDWCESASSSGELKLFFE